MARLTIEVPAEEFVKAIEEAYQKRKGRISIPGFRKGKATRRMIEKMYGKGVFYEDAANELIPKAYDEAVVDCEETLVSRPAVNVVQIEEGKPFIFTADVAIKPEVTLGEYKGVETEVTPVSVTDDEVKAELDKEREKNHRMVNVDDRPVQNGDVVRLDYEGFVDGAPFDGGKDNNYALTIGSGTFIPGFEEQLIGAVSGEDREVKVTFPEQYHAENLKGKDAVFKCHINSIQVKEVPEADDEFAQEVSDFNTLAEFMEDLKNKLVTRKENAARRAKETAVVEAVVQNAQMDIPDAMINEQIRRMLDDFNRRIQSQGITMDQYVQFTGTTVAQLADQMKPEALKRIKNGLVLEAIAKAENIQISEERVEEELQKMAAAYKTEVDKLKERLGSAQIDQIRDDLAVQEAVRVITDAAKEVEKAPAGEAPAQEAAAEEAPSQE